MVAQSSMMARATSDSFLLKYFQPESIPLMIMAAASLSIVLSSFYHLFMWAVSGIWGNENRNIWNRGYFTCYGLPSLFFGQQR